MNSCVFIHTNEKQIVGALLSRFALRRNSAHSDEFEVQLIHTRDHDFLRARDGQMFLRKGSKRVWKYDDLQSFTPLRFKPPELMGYSGRAVVTDPDVFATGDVWELLTRDMDGAAIMCRLHKGKKGARGALATSVMLMDCAKLTHWKCEEQFDELFAFSRDYDDWITLGCEARETIGLLGSEWNDFDHLDPQTRFLHNTKRRTQPWKTGLPVDFFPDDTFRIFPPQGWIERARRRVFGPYAFLGHYQAHPDPKQEQFFFGLLREALEAGEIEESLLRAEIDRGHIRQDAFDLVKRSAALPRVA